MQVELSVDEVRLVHMALQRTRMEIDIDNNGNLKPINHGQAVACRFTIRFTDDLIRRLDIHLKDAHGTGTNS